MATLARLVAERRAVIVMHNHRRHRARRVDPRQTLREDAELVGDFIGRITPARRRPFGDNNGEGHLRPPFRFARFSSCMDKM